MVNDVDIRQAQEQDSASHMDVVTTETTTEKTMQNPIAVASHIQSFAEGSFVVIYVPSGKRTIPFLAQVMYI